MIFKLTAASIALGTALVFGSGAGAQDANLGVGLKLTNEVVNVADVPGFRGPWLVWDNSACKFREADDHPADYTAAVRKIEGNFNFGYMHYGNTNDFGILNSKSIEDFATRAGFKVNTYNLEFPSQTVPLDHARNSITRSDKGVVQANLSNALLPAFYEILEGEGCIPSLQLYLASPGYPSMGILWDVAGSIQGEWLAKEARARGFDSSKTAFAQCTDPESGPSVNAMFPASVAALRDNGFALPEDNLFELVCSRSPEAALQTIRDWFTANPKFDHVLINVIDEVRMAGVVQAVRQSGMNRKSILTISNGLDAQGQQLVCSGQNDASVAFFPERYGEWVVPIMQDIMAGNPVPSLVTNGMKVFTKATIEEAYSCG